MLVQSWLRPEHEIRESSRAILPLSRRAAFRSQQRDAKRRAEPRRGSAGPTNGRASAAAARWPAPQSAFAQFRATRGLTPCRSFERASRPVAQSGWGLHSGAAYLNKKRAQRGSVARVSAPSHESSTLKRTPTYPQSSFSPGFALNTKCGNRVGPSFFRSAARGLHAPAARREASRKARRGSAGPANGRASAAAKS